MQAFFQISRFSLFPGLPLLQVSSARSLSFFLFPLVPISVTYDFCLDAGDGFFKDSFLQLAFPDDDDRPAFGFKLPPCLLVTFSVAGDFCGPELSIGLGDGVFTASVMAVPEATVDKDGGAILGQDDIRLAWELLGIYPVAESVTPESMTQLQLRLC